MIDIKYIRENLEEVKKAIEKRGAQIDWEKLIKLDNERRDILYRIETLRTEAYIIAREKQRNDRAIEIKRMLKDLEPQLQEAEENFKVIAVTIPNIPQEDVPEGKDEKDNKVIKEEGKIALKTGKDHIELGKALDIIDIDRASKVSGSRFYYLKNQAVELEFALIKYALDIVKKEGFQPIIPPILINEEMAWGSGHFEAVNDDAYHMRDDEMVAIGTSEQSILPMHAGETLESLPKRYIGFSTCLRREAGSYGKDVKGILRAHQFDKLELFSFCHPDKSKEEHELIVSLEEKIVSGLELPYRVVNLCAGDLGLPSSKTIDIEIYMPGQGEYRETHSSSNCTDFQSRRLRIKYREGEESGFVHTINGTAVAIGRMLIAIIENYQQEDGSIQIPEALINYCGFKEIEITKTTK
ncbi:MAG: serine--tRNA ligase [Candidatus Berkelbacteria bacterium]|nr:serine--tRNA ligase [Candidatus Berkelbacteria bacterium]